MHAFVLTIFIAFCFDLIVKIYVLGRKEDVPLRTRGTVAFDAIVFLAVIIWSATLLF